jgi:hypothetical protein
VLVEFSLYETHQTAARRGLEEPRSEKKEHNVKTLYEHAGGHEALHRAEELFYDKVLADPVLGHC